MSSAKLAWRSKPRASTIRVKTGCKTCRIRRVKCDEAKPSCLKCISTGRKCDGYDPAKSPKSQKPRKKSDQVLMLHYPLPNPYSIHPSPTIHYATQNEIRAFEFLQVRGVTQLPGYFSSKLWSRYILYLAWHEPSVFCAAAALGSLHAWYTSGMSSALTRVESFAFQQYNRAIGLLTGRGTSPSEATVLASCYIFSCCDALYGNYSSAFSHVASGISLILGSTREIKDCSLLHVAPSEPEDFKAAMMRHFARLDLITGLADPLWVQVTKIYYSSGSSGTMEFRFIDTTANTYLFTSAVISAGIDGVKTDLILEMKDCTVVPSALGPEEVLIKLRDVGATERMLKTLEKSLEVAKVDQEFIKWIGRELHNQYIRVGLKKRKRNTSSR